MRLWGWWLKYNSDGLFRLRIAYHTPPRFFFRKTLGVSVRVPLILSFTLEFSPNPLHYAKKRTPLRQR